MRGIYGINTGGRRFSYWKLDTSWCVTEWGAKGSREADGARELGRPKTKKACEELIRAALKPSPTPPEESHP